MTMPNLTYIPFLALLTACQLDPKNIGTPDDGGASASETGADDSQDATLAFETTHSTEVPDSGHLPSTGVPVDSETFDSASVTSDPTADTLPPIDTDPGGETGGVCFFPDPDIAGYYKVTPIDWPDQSEDEHNFTRACVIETVVDDGDVVTTALTCDVDGTPREVSLVLASPAAGAVDWQTDDAVTLRSITFGDELESDDSFTLTRISDAVLLADGGYWFGDDVPTLRQIGPISRERTAECTVDLDKKIYELTYSISGVDSVSVWSGNRDILDADPGHAYAIDLDHSSSDCCHGSERGLVRRVKL